MHLDEYKEGKLYIEWEDPITKQVSDRYEIVSIDNDYLADTIAQSPALDDAVYSIQLAENLGDDVNFITDDPSGVNSNFIKYGIKTNIYKYVVENRPQFDGRFFVKIYEDETFQANIGKSYIDGLDYRILNSKKVFYMRPEHRLIHTSNIDDFLVKGNDQAPNSLTGGNPGNPEVLNNLYGYYAIREFASMALFFRRYSYGTVSSSSIFTPNNVNLLPVLAHLKPGEGDDQFYPGWTSGLNLNSEYLSDIANPNWTPVSDWNDEYGAKGYYNGGYTNNFNYTEEAFFNRARVEETVYTDADDETRETEVWFIDAGPYAGKAYDAGTNAGNGDFLWSSQHQYETYLGQAVDPGTIDNSSTMFVANAFGDDTSTAADDAQWHGGIINSTNTHRMTLAFGGIQGAKDANSSPGFFNIGNWHTDSGATSNAYSDLEPFVQNLDSGYKFRWKQDPTQTIYTIGGNIASENYLRHSSNLGKSIASFNYPRASKSL
jgi:hypothetical protein